MITPIPVFETEVYVKGDIPVFPFKGHADKELGKFITDGEIGDEEMLPTPFANLDLPKRIGRNERLQLP